MRFVAFALLATGCRTLLGFEPSEVGADAQPCAEWQPLGIADCALGLPSPPLVLTAAQSPYHVDTGEGMLRDKSGAVLAVAGTLVAQSDDSPLFALFVESFTVEDGAVLDAIGLHPLLIASATTMAILGDIDASSEHGSIELGAGADRTSCGSAAPGEIADAMGGSGGGGGGGNHGGGGDGGNGGGNDDTGPGGGGRAASTMGEPALVRGGCRGANSGAAGTAASAPASPSTVARGGAGGGAVHLAARESIDVPLTGRIFAGGAGGAGAELGSACGGGGGGSGGYVGFEADAVIVRGIVAANGGAGGGSAPFAQAGIPGQNGLVSAQRASGGRTSPCFPGGDGGAGVNNVAIAGSDSGVDCGGGGGGGGTGWILIRAATTDVAGATISPAPVDLN